MITDRRTGALLACRRCGSTNLAAEPDWGRPGLRWFEIVCLACGFRLPCRARPDLNRAIREHNRGVL